MSEAERWLVIQKKVDRPHHPHPQTNHVHPHSFLSSFHFYLTKLKDHPLFPKLHSQFFLLQQFQMPGTIQVSVLGLMDLPSSLSSSSSSSISVQVSMGKREYQTWDKGDFSFPVLTLRDNLVITLHDTEGNELSQTGVETLSVIEKGFVDEFFPLEGGGRLHLTLQFILTKEDRKRIQDVRETALKKKQVELLTSSSQRHLETAALASVGGNAVSSSLSLNHEVTDSQEGPVEMEVASNTRVSIQDDSISMSDSCAKDPIPGSGNEVGILQNGQGQPDQVSQECPVEMEAASNTRGSIQDDSISKSDSGTKDPVPGSENEDGIPLNCQEQPGQVKASDSCTKDPIPGSENEDGIPLNCQDQPDQVKASDSCTKDPISGSGNEEGTPLNRPKKPDPNDVDGGEGTSSTIPLSRNLEVHHTEASQNSSEKIKTKLPSTDIPMKTLSSLKALDPHLGFTKSLVTKHSQSVSGTSQKDQIHSPENQGAMKRTSSVKNMISAFESNLSQKFSSPIHALTLKSQLKKPMTEGTLKGPNVQVIEKNRIQDIAEKELSSSSILESQEVNLQRSSTEQKDEIGSKQHKEEHVNEPITLRDELDGKSAEETATVLKRVPVYFPCIEPPSVKSQQSKTTIEGSLKGLNVGEATSETSKAHKVAETAPSLPSIEMSQDMNLQQSMTPVRGEGDEIGLKQHKEENVNEHGTLLEEFAGTSAVEIGATSRGMPDKHVDRDQSCSASKDQQDSTLEVLGSDEIGLKQPKEEIVNEHGTLLKELAGTSAVEIDANSRRMPDKPADRDQSCNASKDQQDSDMLDIPVSSNENNQSVVYSGDEQYSFDSLGSCTFLDDSRRLCITTGSKQVMDLVCSCDVTAESNQKKILSSTEALNKQNRDGSACKEVNKNGKGSCYLRKSKLERTADVGASRQLIGQAVRVAIMVAFGTFVFIMREKK